MTGLAHRLARPDILALRPFELAPRDGGDIGRDAVRLDANENPFPPLVDGPLARNLNRYPEPQPAELAASLAAIYSVPRDNLLLTRGGDDAIDILIRAYCRPGEDAVIVCPPTFSAYAHFARVQGARVLEAPLPADFALDADAVIAAARADGRVKIVFVCSPNNPTGDVTPRETLLHLCEAMPDTLVMVDAAYVEFAEADADLTAEAGRVENLVVLRTLSKAWGLASTRIGALVGDPDVLEIVARTLPPYPFAGPAIEAALAGVSPSRRPLIDQRLTLLKAERIRLAAALAGSPWLASMRKGGGNFLFLQAHDADALAARLAERGVRVRFRPNAARGGVRLTVGTPEENQLVLAAFDVATAPTATRRAEVTRDTRETSIAVAVGLDRAEPRHIRTGLGFYDHMLEQIAAHAGISVVLECRGDLQTDPHHTVEDCALALGAALCQALGDRRGIGRYGFVTPMDEAEAAVSLDLSGRPYCRFDGSFAVERIGDYPTALTSHVFRSMADSLGAAIHVRVTGEDDHHKTEACFKAFGRALRQAVRFEGGETPSTKGVL